MLEMSCFPPRSPSEKVSGIVYFGRMLDKFRAQDRGEVPAEYQPNLGRGFDESCVSFLRVSYPDVVELVNQGLDDEQILQWCFANGRKPSAEEIHVWNTFMLKRGWNDEISETLARRKAEAGMSERTDIRTMFDFIDADEGRALADSRRV